MAVSISFVKNHLWLRSGNSELLITPEHIVELHKRHDKKEFANYFLRQALLNRPARKLFQSWARKDTYLWQNLYTLIINLKFAPPEGQQQPDEQQMEGGEGSTERAGASAEASMGKETIIEAEAEEISAEASMNPDTGNATEQNEKKESQ